MLRPGTFLARLAALAILALVLIGAYQLVAQPLLASYWGNRDKIASTAELLQRYRALAAERPALAVRLSAIEGLNEAGSGFLSGPSDALAAAQLQDLTDNAIRRAGGEIRSTQILPAAGIEDGSLIRRAGLKLRFSASTDSLATTLFDLETIEPRLFIEQLLITTRQANPLRANGDDSLDLDVRLDIVGYFRRPN
ncbi:MAG: type II secretion system protein GspM [Geminicoccaceae bacterium]